MYYFDDARLDQINRHARERIRTGRLQGTCSAVTDLSGNVRTFVNGLAFLNGEPLTENHIFRLASMTKPITAAALMIQSERGYVRITEPVSRYLPEFAEMKLYDGTPAKPVEVRHLLSHCSGVAHDEFGMSEFVKVAAKEGDTLETVVPRYAKMRLPFQPGERSGYSAIAGFDILARIVEVTSGQRFGDFLKENIFDPLDMKDTTFHPTPEQKKRIVELCTTDEKGVSSSASQSIFPGFPEGGYEAAGAGLVGTLGDYMRFARMLLQRGQLDGVRVLTPRTVEQMASPAMPYTVPGIGDEVCWGLGMRVIRHLNGYSAPLSVGTFGWSGAFGTHFFIDPVLKVAAVYMSNLDNAGGAGAETAFEFENDVISAIVE